MTIKQQIIETIRRAPMGCTNTELSRRLSVRADTVASHTHRLWKAGVLTRAVDEDDRGNAFRYKDGWVYKVAP